MRITTWGGEFFVASLKLYESNYKFYYTKPKIIQYLSTKNEVRCMGGFQDEVFDF